jgi:hypothetical protein
MLAQVDTAEPAAAKTFEDLVLADGEAAPLALEDLLGLEDRQDTVTDQCAGDLGRLRREAASGPQASQVSAEALLIHDTTLLDKLQKLLGGSRGGHGCGSDGGGDSTHAKCRRWRWETHQVPAPRLGDSFIMTAPGLPINEEAVWSSDTTPRAAGLTLRQPRR